MDKEEFNIYCAEVMGEEFTLLRRTDTMWLWNNPDIEYNPYDDLNQMADVVTEISMLGKYTADYKELVNDLVLTIPVDIKQAFRDFIISTSDKQRHSTDKQDE